MWRDALYVKLEKLGFGGKTLNIIKSMYCNDSLKFLINGKYSDSIWITRGVKQGWKEIFTSNVLIPFFYF